jgi:hypothetical protein
MDRTADLETALGFVVARIEEEAARSGEPLNDDQRFLLNDLPKESDWPQAFGSAPDSWVVFVPRDTTYERLVAVAKAAYHNDLRLNPASALDWEFVAAVAKLNRHPMSWLLDWAGVRVRRPWWDRCLLIAVVLLLLFSVVPLMLLAGSAPWTRFQWTGVGGGYVAIFVLLFLFSRRIEKWQLKQTIQRCRSGPPFQRTSP